jgi:hypothetical protein
VRTIGAAGTDIKTDKDYGRISAPRHVERVAALLQKTEGKVLPLMSLCRFGSDVIVPLRK